MSRRAVMLFLTVSVLTGLGACGEKPAVTVYKQGQYQGKPDNVPWQSAPFNNNQVEWEKAIKARNNNQNEYMRASQQ